MHCILDSYNGALPYDSVLTEIEVREPEYLSEPAILRIVRAINKVSLSILELREYDVLPNEINQALAQGIIQFDRPSSWHPSSETGIPYGDSYYQHLNSKIKLTELGLAVLDKM